MDCQRVFLLLLTTFFLFMRPTIYRQKHKIATNKENVDVFDNIILQGKYSVLL